MQIYEGLPKSAPLNTSSSRMDYSVKVLNSQRLERHYLLHTHWHSMKKLYSSLYTHPLNQIDSPQQTYYYYNNKEGSLEIQKVILLLRNEGLHQI